MKFETSFFLFEKISEQLTSPRFEPFFNAKDLLVFSSKNTSSNFFDKDVASSSYLITSKKSLSVLGFIKISSENMLDLLLKQSALTSEDEFSSFSSFFEFLSQNEGKDELFCFIHPKDAHSLALANRFGMTKDLLKTKTSDSFFLYSLKKRTLVSYQDSWPLLYKEEAEKLQKIFDQTYVIFHHIGSTSIPGCIAKPIIDILGITSDITLIDNYNTRMLSIEYEAKGEYGMKQRRLFSKRGQTSVNLHIFEDTDPEVKRHLRFCKYLRSHKDERDAYSKLKRDLSKQLCFDIHGYTLAKTAFIKSIDRKAALESKIDHFSFKLGAKKQSWSVQEILKAMEVNKNLHMTYFSKYIPTQILIFDPDVTLVQSTLSDDMFNYALSASFKTENVEDKVRSILKMYKDKQISFSWWLGPEDTPKTLDRILESCGFVFKEENVGMALDLLAFTPLDPCKELTFEQVLDVEKMRSFTDILGSLGVNQATFDVIYSQIPEVLYQKESCYHLYIASYENTPVATGILVFHANVAGIYFITTHPEWRNKGCATSMMHFLLSKAKQKGYSLATLQASYEGKNLYKKLGFEEIASFKEFIPA